MNRHMSMCEISLSLSFLFYAWVYVRAHACVCDFFLVFIPPKYIPFKLRAHICVKYALTTHSTDYCMQLFFFLFIHTHD